MLLAEVALLSQSRGSLYATPVMLVLVFALLPGAYAHVRAAGPDRRSGSPRRRPSVLDVGDHLDRGAVTHAAVHSATSAMFLAALLVGLVVAAGAAVESRRELSASARAQVQRGVAALAIATLVVLRGGRAGGGGQSGQPHPAGLGQLQGRLLREQHEQRSADQRPRQQPLRLLPRRARRIPRAPAARDRRGQLPAAVPRSTAAATRRRTIRTASSCERSRRRGCSVRCWRSWGSARRCSQALARCARATRSRAPSRPRRWPASATGWCTARSTGSGSSPGWGRRRSRCSGSAARSRRRRRSARWAARARRWRRPRARASPAAPPARARRVRAARAARRVVARGSVAQRTSGAERGARLDALARGRPTRGCATPRG